MYKGSS